MKTGLNATNVRVFEAVARLQSVTLAAEELETSQPYVSKQIAVMEEQLAVQLFARVGRRLYLTQAGELLHQHTKVVVESLKEAEEMLSRAASASQKRLRIATSTTGMYMLPEWLAGFEKKVADLETTVLVTSGDEVERQVISGEADLGFIASRPRFRSFLVSVVAEDSLALAVQKDHPLATHSSVSLDELSKERFIVREPESASRALTERRIFQKRPDWRFRLQINHIDAIKSSLEEGLGISFISRRAIDRELQSGTLATIPVDGVDLRRPICMLTDAHKFGSKIAVRLAKHIASHASQNFRC
ncbi:LysR family transcriptional regulator [Tunturiibacter gelidoferens]|uniref:LysR family transcriptional regulator n=1 Tax=Tunturiibacter gelidiferens TaxID=3069689 RepID=A0AAU7Z0V8_9BACT